MLDNKKILIAAGGTGGHINPALGTAGYITEKHPSAQIVFVGTADKMEARLVPQAGYELKTIEISGFWRSFSPDAIKHNIIKYYDPRICIVFPYTEETAYALCEASGEKIDLS